MITITIKDWTGMQVSKTDMGDDELGYDGDVDRIKRMAQMIALDKTASVKIELNGNVIATASYIEQLL